MDSLVIVLRSLLDLKIALRDLAMKRPPQVLLTCTQTQIEEAVIDRLATFRLPSYVTALTVMVFSAPSKRLLDVIVKMVANGPTDIRIQNWPDGQMRCLLDALLDKKDLSELSIATQNHSQPFAKLANRLTYLDLQFVEGTVDKDWSDLANAIATSPTLIYLFFTGFVPETVFPPNLPMNLRTFRVESDWTIAFGWLSHGYWPTQLEKLEISTVHSFLELPELSGMMKARLCGVRSLRIDVGRRILDTLCELLSSENCTDHLTVKQYGTLDRLLQVLTSPFALMSKLRINHTLDDADTLTLWRTVRGKTRARSWNLLSNDDDWYSPGDDWFSVIQALLSVHQVPSLKVKSFAGLVSWRDHIHRIADTLGWDLAKYSE